MNYYNSTRSVKFRFETTDLNHVSKGNPMVDISRAVPMAFSNMFDIFKVVSRTSHISARFTVTSYEVTLN